jgi:Tol biopolymer transport system component
MKTKIVILCIVTVATAALVLSASMQQSASQLYQSGIYKEDVEGNLEEAIVAYQEIIEKFPSDGPVAAKAWLHIGLCHEKLGNQEAQKAYERLIQDYPTQKQEVAMARERLTQLISSLKKEPVQPIFRKIRILTKSDGDMHLSPDGGKISLVSDKKLWITPLSGNLGPDFPGAPSELDTENVPVFWGPHAWSGDGKWIAFSDYPPGATNEYSGNLSIYVVSSQGGKPKKVYENYRGERMVNYRISLSPNGKILAFSSVDLEKNEQHIYTIPVDGGSPKQLVNIQAREPVFSPDGSMIAFVEDKNLGRGGGGLWVVSAQGGTPTHVTDAVNASSPIWSPSGNMIAYLDDGSKKNQVNFVPIGEDGKVTGARFTIDAPEGYQGAWLLSGWSPDNRIGAIFTKPGETGLYTLPAKGGKAVQVALGGGQPRWSPDGKRIYCIGVGGGWQGLAIGSIPAEGGKFTAIPLQSEMKMHIPGFGVGNRVSPDGKRIVFSGKTQSDLAPYSNNHIWTLPVEGGVPEQLTVTPQQGTDMYPCWSPDGKTIAFVRTRIPVKFDTNDFKANIYFVQANGGEPTPLTTESDSVNFEPIEWSPDGRFLAYLSSKDLESSPADLRIISAQGGGKSRVIGSVEGVNPGSQFTWSPDSKRIAFDEPGGKIKIISIEDGSIAYLDRGLINSTIGGRLDWSPDGEKFVFVGGTGGSDEFLVMENFLPTNRSAVSPEAKQAAREQTKPAPKFRQIEIPGKPPIRSAAMLSPDGNRFAFLAEGDIWTVPVSGGVHPNIAGEPVRLTKNMNAWEAGNCTVTWSTDGHWIAFRVRPDHSVYLVPASGGEPRRVDGIGPAPGGAQSMRISVSQAGKRVVFAAGENLRPRLFTIPGEGGRPIQLVPEIAVEPAFSPNGKLVAYIKGERTASGRFPSIMAVATDGGKPVLISSLPRNASTDSPVWSPDGRMIAFPVVAEESRELWIVPVSSDGRPEAEPTKFDLNPIAEAKLRGKSVYKFMDPLGGWSRKNEIALLLEKPEDSAIYRVPASGGRATLIGLDGRTPRWSPDGKRIYFRGRTNIESVAAEGGDEKSIPIRYKIPLIVWFPTGSNEISKDGRSITFAGGYHRNEDHPGEVGVYTVPSQGGEARPVALPTNGSPLSPSWSPDGKWIAYRIVGPEPDGRAGIWISPSEGGEAKELTSDADRVGEGEVRWSPDGKTIAYFGSDKTLRLIPSTGGPSRVLTQVPAEDILMLTFYGLSWSPDGSKLVYTTFEKVWVISASGGEPQEIPVGFDGSRIMQIDWSPDGRTLAFTGVSGAEEEVWLMSDFLHLVKTAR